LKLSELWGAGGDLYMEGSRRLWKLWELNILYVCLYEDTEEVWAAETLFFSNV